MAKTRRPLFARHQFRESAILSAFLALAFVAVQLEPAAGEERAVPTYHAEASRSGHFIVPGLTWERARTLHRDQDFEAHFPGHVHAQPLYWRPPREEHGVLVVATEENSVHALDSKSGQEVWRRLLGPPVPRSALGCGNIDPLGITGTPVIDPDSGSLYLDAMTQTMEGPRHLVFGLSLKDGSILPGWPVDIGEALKAKGETFNARDQNERGALIILNGTLYVPFGGHFGDCGDYRGRIIGLPLKEPRQIMSWATRARGGGIWAPGGIATDGNALFFATGNTFGPKQWGDGEAVFRLSADLHHSDSPQDFFAAADWRELDEHDADLGGSNPLLFDLPSQDGITPLVLALGKDGKAYLLGRNNLGGIGGALAVELVSLRPIRTSPAAYPARDGIFIAFQGPGTHCPDEPAEVWQTLRRKLGAANNQLTVLKIRNGSPPSIATAWCGALRGEGAPIATTSDGHSDPIIWILGAEGDNRLHGFRGDTGEPLLTGGADAEAMTGLHHFQTLIAAEDHLYAAADGRIYAFAF
jgi:hypothetical protein